MSGIVELSEGRIVELKSGGPPMTVHAIEGGEAVCRWFTGDGKLQERTFALTTIRRVDVQLLTDKQLNDLLQESVEEGKEPGSSEQPIHPKAVGDILRPPSPIKGIKGLG